MQNLNTNQQFLDIWEIRINLDSIEIAEPSDAKSTNSYETRISEDEKQEEVLSPNPNDTQKTTEEDSSEKSSAQEGKTLFYKIQDIIGYFTQLVTLKNIIPSNLTLLSPAFFR